MHMLLQSLQFVFRFTTSPATKYPAEKQENRRGRDHMVVGFTFTYAISA